MIHILTGNIEIREMTEADLPLMLKWLTDDRVLEFYGGRDLKYNAELLRDHYMEQEDGLFFRTIVEYEGLPVGYCQFYELDDEMRKEYAYPLGNDVVFATDQFIGEPEYWNRGIGSSFLKAVVDFLRREYKADAVLLDPHKNNPRAIRAYEKAGFTIIGELPAHELFEGEKADCFLMEAK